MGSVLNSIEFVSASQADAGHDGQDDALGEILEARLHLRVAEQPSSPSTKVVGPGCCL